MSQIRESMQKQLISRTPATQLLRTDLGLSTRMFVCITKVLANKENAP